MTAASVGTGVARGRRPVMDAVLDLAERQHGVVLVRQLVEVGLSYKVIRGLRDEGVLGRVWPGVCVTGARVATPWQRAVAAGLVAGPGAALSHATAGRIHRLPGLDLDGAVELTVPTLRHPRVPGATLHRVTSLAPADVVEHRGVAVTAPARTLIDLAPRLSEGLLTTVVDEGMVSRLWTVGSLEAALGRVPRQRGVGSIRKVLEARRDWPEADSILEMRVARALQALRPFEVRYQVVLDGRVFVLDLAWPEAKVAAECDGWTVRSRSRRKFDHDRRRENLLSAHGWVVAHLTSAMSDEEMLTAVVQLLMRRAAGA